MPLYLQGYKPAEDLEPGDITDGFAGPVTITSKELRPRKDMAPLVMLGTVEGQRLRYEPTFPVALYGPERVLVAWPGKRPDEAPRRVA